LTPLRNGVLVVVFAVAGAGEGAADVEELDVLDEELTCSSDVELAVAEVVLVVEVDVVRGLVLLGVIVSSWMGK
jgi:hypothetical protein